MQTAKTLVENWVKDNISNLYKFQITEHDKGYLASVTVSVYTPEDDGANLEFLGDFSFDKTGKKI